MPKGNQSKGLASTLRASNSTVGHTDSATKRQDAAKLDAVLATRKNKPPHRHRFIDGLCTVCACPEVDSS